MSTTNQQKFENQSPIQQWLITKFQQRLLELLVPLHAASVLEVGCGEGYLLRRITTTLPAARVLGLDTNPEALAEGRRLFPELRLETGDIYQIAQPDNAWDVVIASEVLEHLDQPERALQELKRVAKNAVLLSVPHEPWFRLGNLARGRHLSRFGNHPEHINLWSRSAFGKFVRSKLPDAVVTGSFPWTLVAAKV